MSVNANVEAILCFCYLRVSDHMSAEGPVGIDKTEPNQIDTYVCIGVNAWLARECTVCILNAFQHYQWIVVEAKSGSRCCPPT